MPDPSLLDNAEHWRKRAEATRTIADGISWDKSSQDRLYRIASEYEKLAARAEERMACKPKR
jgi:hypothetical protein